MSQLHTVTGGCHPGGPMSQSHSHRRMTPRRTKCHSYTQSQEVVTQADQVSQLHTVTGRCHPGGPSVTVTQSQKDDTQEDQVSQLHTVTGRRHPGGPSVTVTQSQEDDTQGDQVSQSYRRMTPRGTRCNTVTGG